MNAATLRTILGLTLLALAATFIASGDVYADKEFLIQGTVDCGRASGQRCDLGDTVTVWTADVSGKRERVKIDVSWIAKQLDRYEQDDLICIDVRMMSDGTLQGIAISPTCGAPPPKRRVSDDDGANVKGDPTATPTQVTHVAPALFLDLSLTKTSRFLNDTDCPPPIPSRLVCLEWIVVVTNEGTATGTNVTVFDAADDLVTEFYESAAEPGTTYTPIDLVSGTWDIGTLTPGQVVTLRLYSNAPGSFDQLNCAEIETAEPEDVDSTPGNGVDGEDDRGCRELAG